MARYEDLQGLPQPQGWPRRVRSAMLQVISLEVIIIEGLNLLHPTSPLQDLWTGGDVVVDRRAQSELSSFLPNAKITLCDKSPTR